MPECIIHIAEGKVQNPTVLKNALRSLTEGRYVVKIDKATKRSLNQNAYLHGVLIPCFRSALYEAGYDEVKTNEDAKDIMKLMFLKKRVVNKETGEVLEFPGHTAELTTVEMATLFEDVFKFCAESLNYFIPSPLEQLQINY